MGHDRTAAPFPDTVAITGGKGGVGKSTLAVNLSVALARLGRRVLLVDGDLGLANLDVLMGLRPERTVDALVRGDATVEELLVEGPSGVLLLPAVSGAPGLAQLDARRCRHLVAALTRAARTVDHMIVDTGAGLGPTSLGLLLAADRVLLVTTPEPTALVDAYASLKVLWKTDPAKPVAVVVNDVVDRAESESAYRRIAEPADRFLGRAPGLIGAIPRDPRVAEAVRQQQVVHEIFPHCPAAVAYRTIARELAARPAEGSGENRAWTPFTDPNLSEYLQ